MGARDGNEWGVGRGWRLVIRLAHGRRGWNERGVWAGRRVAAGPARGAGMSGVFGRGWRLVIRLAHGRRGWRAGRE